MLGLVLTDRHKIRLVKQNVRCHQAWVGKQPGVDVVGVLLRFVLKLRHTLQFAELGVAVQNPRKLGVGGNVALQEKRTALRVNAAGKQQCVGFQCVVTQFRGFLSHGDGVQVC